MPFSLLTFSFCTGFELCSVFLQWRDRLVSSLREMKAGELAEEALQQVLRGNSPVRQVPNLIIEFLKKCYSRMVITFWFLTGYKTLNRSI